MMTFDKIATATLNQLTDELAAAGWDSTQTELADAQAAVARLLNSVVGLDLYCSDTCCLLRSATDDEAAESVNAGPEGHILVDGRRCYVA